ncbi:hypothetical protein TNCV_3091521 [Trichonephila clavipes]|nr:hypothetical protein TNCV_3091521 [Trichonephila clavipes]
MTSHLHDNQARVSTGYRRLKFSLCEDGFVVELQRSRLLQRGTSLRTLRYLRDRPIGRQPIAIRVKEIWTSKRYHSLIHYWPPVLFLLEESRVTYFQIIPFKLRSRSQRSGSLRKEWVSRSRAFFADLCIKPKRFRQPFLEGDGTIAIWDFYISLELEQNEREVEHCT